MIDVQKNGVSGDGDTDNQPALQALIDKGGDDLYFPPGRYRIDSTLVVPRRKARRRRRRASASQKTKGGRK